MPNSPHLRELVDEDEVVDVARIRNGTLVDDLNVERKRVARKVKLLPDQDFVLLCLLSLLWQLFNLAEDFHDSRQGRVLFLLRKAEFQRPRFFLL